MARAWVNFDGTGTVAIRSAFGVSSVTDNGTGTYTINFASAFANSNYCLTATAEENGAREKIVSIMSQSASSTQVRVRGGGGSISDVIILNAIVMA